jgi:hypothetical protein
MRTSYLFSSVLLGLLSIAPFASAQDFDAAGEQAMLDRINALRAERSLSGLARSAALDGVARGHSMDMASRSQLAHVSPTSGTPEDRVNAAGIEQSAVAENVALHRDSAQAFNALLNSPPHLSNILHPDLTHIGLASLLTSEGVYVTQVFTRMDAEQPEAPVAPAIVPVEPAPQEELSLFQIIPPFVEMLGTLAPEQIAPDLAPMAPEALAPMIPELAPEAVEPEEVAPAPQPRRRNARAPRATVESLSPNARATLRELVGLAQSLLGGGEAEEE